MPRLSPLPLSLRLALASVASVTAVLCVALVGLVSLDHVGSETRIAITRQLELLNDASAFESVLFQKGFAAEYMLTGDRVWLTRLERSRAAFEPWLERARAGVLSDAVRGLLKDIEREYGVYDDIRRRMLALHDSGQRQAAQALLDSTHTSTERLLQLFQRFGELGREQARHTLEVAESSVRRRATALVGVSVVASLASLLIGFWWARRVTRPIYELQLQVESAYERTRIQLKEDRGDLAGLGNRVAAIVERLEDANVTLLEQRRRLIQSEKLSAVGELAAKMAHEILNPLTGMKAAVQLLALDAAEPGTATVRDTATALDREIRRVEALVRRLVDYSRPLLPRFEVVPVARLLDSALDAAKPDLDRSRAQMIRREAKDLPPLEVDPLLVVQVLRNLLANAAEVTPADGSVELAAAAGKIGGRDCVVFSVLDDGPGIPVEMMPHLFHPFFTTKPGGHGLGLAVSQNIALEHGGRIEAANREGRPGAVFRLTVPVVR